MALLLDLRSQLEAGQDAAADVLRRIAALRHTTTSPVHASRAEPALPYWVADDFLRAVALALVAWSWVRIENANTTDASRWSQPAEAFRNWVLPQFVRRLARLRKQVEKTMQAHA